MRLMIKFIILHHQLSMPHVTPNLRNMLKYHTINYVCHTSHKSMKDMLIVYYELKILLLYFKSPPTTYTYKYIDVN